MIPRPLGACRNAGAGADGLLVWFSASRIRARRPEPFAWLTADRRSLKKAPTGLRGRGPQGGDDLIRSGSIRLNWREAIQVLQTLHWWPRLKPESGRQVAVCF